MKLLLDENLPHDLRHFITGHDVFTVAYMNWSSVENGGLLRAAGDAGFDAMLTLDSGVAYGQHLAGDFRMRPLLDVIRNWAGASQVTPPQLRCRALSLSC